MNRPSNKKINLSLNRHLRTDPVTLRENKTVDVPVSARNKFSSGQEMEKIEVRQALQKREEGPYSIAKRFSNEDMENFQVRNFIYEHTKAQ